MSNLANKDFAAATIAVQTGLNTDKNHQSVVAPIYMASNYKFEDLNNRPEYEYSRSGNPTRDLLANALTELEYGAGSVVTSSGMAAINLVLNLLSKDDVIVAPQDCYGGTYRLFDSFAQRGVFKLVWLDYYADDIEQQIQKIKPSIVWIETPSNPLLRITDIKKLSTTAKSVGARTVVDNTFLSPIGQTPLKLGADIVVHSSTKYLNGHSDVVSGAVVCANADDHEQLTWWANNTGVTGSPFDSYLILRGIRTLPLRIKQHSKNAQSIAEVLDAHDLVKLVNFPGLPSHPDHELACRQQKYNAGMLSFELNGDINTVNTFIKNLQLFTLAESLGGTESLVCHPSTMTHAAMNEEAQRTAGITTQLVRFSVGIEDKADLVADVIQALSIANVEKNTPNDPDVSAKAGLKKVLDDDSVDSAACRLSPALAALW